MSKNVKIFVITLFLVVSAIVLHHFQAKRLVLKLIESNISDNVEVGIGSFRINLFRSSLSLSDVWVKVKDNHSDNFKKSTIKKAYLDVASLWNFYFGGTLIIEKLKLEGGEVLLYNHTADDTTKNISFDLNSIIQRIEADAIRFQIKDISISDYTIIMMKDSAHVPTTIKHLQLRARDLYLNADSIFKKKPLIEFSLPSQTILFSSGLRVGFDSLFFSTSNNAIQLNKLKLSSPTAPSGNSYQVNADKVRIAHFDFETLYKNGMVVIDSVFLGQSKLIVNWKLVSLGKDKTKPPGLPSIPEIEIAHLMVKDLSSNITVKQDSIENTFDIDDTFVVVEDFRHKPDSSKIISIKDFNITMARYSTFLSNKSTSIHFDTIQLKKNKLYLLNFKFGTDEQKEPLLQTPRFEFNQVDWYALLINKKLVAREARILNPIIHASINSKSNSASEDDLVVFSNLREFLDVQLFSLENATAYVKVKHSGIDFSLNGTYATVHIEALLESMNFNQRLRSIDRFKFQKLEVTHPDFIGRIENFSFKRGMMFFGILDYTAQDHLHFSTRAMSLAKITWNHPQNVLTVSGLGWNEMHVDMAGSEQAKPQRDDNLQLPVIRINQVSGRNTKLEFSRQQQRLNTLLDHFNLEELQLDSVIRMIGIQVAGRNFVFRSVLNIGTVQTYSLTDQGGKFENIQFSRATDSLNMFIDHISIRANMEALVNRTILVEDVNVEGMKTRYLKRDSAQEVVIEVENNLELKDIRFYENKLTMQSLLLESGSINFLHTKEVQQPIEEPTTNATRFIKSRLSIGVDTLFDDSNSSLTMKQRQNDLLNRKVPGADSSQMVTQITQVKSGKGGIRLYLHTLEADVKDSMVLINVRVDSLKFNQVAIKNNNLSALVESGSFSDLTINSNSIEKPREWIIENYLTAGIENLKGRIETNGNLIQVNRLDYDPLQMRGTVRGFEFRPLKSIQEVLDQSYYQINYIHAGADSISFHELNLKEFLEDSVMHLESLHVGSPDLEIHRDKTHPFFSTHIKFLPTNAFQKMKLKFKIDTVRISDGKISYTEKSRRTEKEGTIYFTQLQGLVTNIKNIDLHDHDSLFVNARTRFLDSARVVLRVKESYKDTLGGFLLSTNVSPFHTSILNTALIPMVAVEFQSGYVDTLLMHAIGKEYTSLGTMKFLYHDLKVKFLDKNDTARHSLKNELLRIAANTFVIRSKNTKRLGTVYYERDRNRAVFQYWIKMILSGVATSVGAKSNRKQVKKYMKDLNQRKLPSVKTDFNL